MRVIIVQPWIRAGGAERLSLELAAELEAGGDQAPIVALFLDPRGLPSAKLTRTFVLPPQPLAGLFARSRALTFLFGPAVLFGLVLRAGRTADVLNPHNLPAPVVAALARRVLRRPVVWTCNEVPQRLRANEEWRVGVLDAIGWRLAELIDRPAASAAAEILVLSEKTRAAVWARYRREATVARPGTDLESFGAVHRKASVRMELLWVAKLHPQKDPLLAVRALVAVRARGVDAALTMVGDGPERGAVDALVATSGLEGHVRVEPLLAHAALVAAYARSDALLVTAGGHQSWGLTPFEALAAGTPAVVSADAGSAEVLGPAQAALISERDPESFATAVLRLRDEPGLGGRLVANGQRLATELTWRRYAERCREVYVRAMMPVGPA